LQGNQIEKSPVWPPISFVGLSHCVNKNFDRMTAFIFADPARQPGSLRREEY
jgi:hypothetical protein